ncbi:MAG: hypothetical protein HN736_16265 [Anaerolineae bacterium]|jgi:hypothetical protein|nr:hypothetical protein [Anaerolineae bacterium]MBT3714410.1 hypothetical protein [Anaerolineae bacterium]MBT4312078.1 hypothetical protein [Anaerolineae bacterium]MBT4457129.1 hypothetical protein [Anaerolineae bacterium]MBT4843114.1 hypothetical protein [Anaerolineae bacterium]
MKPSFRPYLYPTLALAIVGWVGLYLLISFTLPTLLPRWAFFFLATLTLSGTALPVVYFFHRRFGADFPPANVITRQALWVGVYGATLSWLQLGKVVNLSIIIGLALGLIAIESLIRVREKSQWTPPEIEND